MNITVLTCFGKSCSIKLLNCFGPIKICSPCYSLSRSSALDMLRWCLFSNGVTNPSMVLIFRPLDQLFHMAFLFHTYYWTVLAANHEENQYSAQTDQRAWIYRLEIAHWKGDFLKVFSKCGQQVTLSQKSSFQNSPHWLLVLPQSGGFEAHLSHFIPSGKFKPVDELAFDWKKHLAFFTWNTFTWHQMCESLPTPFYDLQEVPLQMKTSVGHVKLSLLILRSYRFSQNNWLSERPAKNSTESILRPRSRAEFIIKYAWYFNVKHDTQPRENLRNMPYLQYRSGMLAFENWHQDL